MNTQYRQFHGSSFALVVGCAVLISGCSPGGLQPNEGKGTNSGVSVRAPAVDAAKPLYPQLFPRPTGSNAWEAVVKTADTLKSERIDLSSLLGPRCDKEKRHIYVTAKGTEALRADLLNGSTFQFTSPRSDLTLGASFIPDYAAFRTVTRFMAVVFADCVESKRPTLATDVLLAGLRIAQGMVSESTLGILTGLACEQLLLAEASRLAKDLDAKSRERIAISLLGTALNKTRFTSGVRSDYAMIYNLLVDPDLVSVIAGMDSMRSPAEIEKVKASYRSTPDRLDLMRAQVREYARICEQTDMHVLGQASLFLSTNHPPKPAEDPGIVGLVQTFPGTSVSSVIQTATLERMSALYMRAISYHQVNKKWPSSVGVLGTSYETIQVIADKPFVIRARPGGGGCEIVGDGIPIAYGAKASQVRVFPDPGSRR